MCLFSGNFERQHIQTKMLTWGLDKYLKAYLGYSCLCYKFIAVTAQKLIFFPILKTGLRVVISVCADSLYTVKYSILCKLMKIGYLQISTVVYRP